MANVVFVAPYALPATSRFVDAVLGVRDARVGLLSSDPLESFAAPSRDRLAGHWRIANCLDVGELCAGVSALGAHLGSVNRLTAILENLQVPLAEARQRLGLPGLDVEVASNFRDKERMKTVFDEHGIPCARHRRVGSAQDVLAFASDVGFPFVVKPLAGAGARGTFRIESADHLGAWLEETSPADWPLLVEEFLVGQEHSFDSVVVEGRLEWHSVGRYEPTPLNVIENPWIQWCVVLPREIQGVGYDDIRVLAARAISALGLHTGFSHLEWFRRPDGSLAISEVAARPPGAQFMTLMSWAHDTDLYAAWADFAVHDRFEPPARQYAAGAAYLRAQGLGHKIKAVHGLARVSDATRSRVVEARLPEPGQAVTGTYEGDGYVVVRDRETHAVEEALGEIVTTIQVECA
jgi:ATP-grasp domain